MVGDQPEELVRWAVLLWGCEQTLIRISAGAPQPVEALLSAVFLGGLAALAGWRRELSWLSWLGLLWVSASLWLPVWVWQRPPPWAWLGVLGVGALGVHALWRRRPWPSPLHVVGGMGCALLAAVPASSEGMHVLLVCLAVWGVLLGATVSTRWGWQAVGLAILVGWGPDPSLFALRATGPDLVLITVDSLRADDAATLGVVADLAARGTRFSQAVSPAPWTLPAMATLLTGTAVATHGAGRRADGLLSGLDAEQPTLAEALRAAGYHTHAVVGANAFLTRRYGFARGFDSFDHVLEPFPGGLPTGRTPAQRPQPLIARLVARVLGSSTPGQDATALVAQARRRLRGPGPHFVWLHLMDAHLPYGGDPLQRMRPELLANPNLNLVQLRAQYRAGLDVLDPVLRAFVTTLPASTLVAFTADHGEAFGDHEPIAGHPDLEHGHALHPELLSVPMLVAGAGSPHAVRDEVVGLVDLAPTLLGALELPPLGEGRDLGQQQGASRYPLSNLFYPWGAVAGVRTPDAWLRQGNAPAPAGGWPPAWVDGDPLSEDARLRALGYSSE